MNGAGDILFKFVWTIENFQLESLEILKSPKFCIRNRLNPVWCLEFNLLLFNVTLHCRATPFYVLACGLKRSESSGEPGEINITFRLNVCKNLSALSEFRNKQTEVFRKGSSVLYHENFAASESFLSCPFINVICLMWIDKEEIQRHVSNLSSLNIRMGTPEFFMAWESLENRNNVYQSSSVWTVEPVKKQKYVWSMEFIMDSYETNHLIFAQTGICLSTYSRFPDFLITLRINEENTITVTIRKKNIELPECINLFSVLWISDKDMSKEKVCSFLWDEHLVSELELETREILSRNPNFNLRASSLNLEMKITSEDPIIWTETTPEPICYNVNDPHSRAVYDAQLNMEIMYM